jgi:glutamate/tyrosine decarboxylase-like PLP-dependent enzyme
MKESSLTHRLSLCSDLFPRNYDENYLADYCAVCLEVLREIDAGKGHGRVPGWLEPERYEELVEQYGTLPDQSDDFKKTMRAIVRDFLPGAVQWRSTNLMHNVGAAVNVAVAAVQAVTSDLNVYLIDDGLAGNAIMAERAVSMILAGLAGVDRSHAHGVFTFGGTGTNLYAMKIGTRQVWPDSGLTGIPQGTFVFVTEDSHFSHQVAADWLGLGVQSIVEMSASEDRSTNLVDAEAKMRAVLERGQQIAALLINGGTTYDHTVDDIPAFVQLRDRLVREYHLPYIPHLHVDSVIGWAWLHFSNYDFERNELELDEKTLGKIRAQYKRIQHIRLADSWGVDFHKGVGSCPVDCSMVMVNDPLLQEEACKSLH